jgi:hypothetical protein
MYVYDRPFFVHRLKINHASHWAYEFILEFSTVANNWQLMVWHYCGEGSLTSIFPHQGDETYSNNQSKGTGL